MISIPMFSIITICFNEKDGITSTIESICGQTYKNYEWIVIDGGSTDGTIEILESYRSSMSIFISEADEGIYDAMNKGIKKASGKYLLFMNGGDRFSGPDVLAAVAKAPERNLIVGNMMGECDDGHNRIAPEKISREYFMRTCLPHQSTFIARRLFQKYGLYDTSYKIVADLEFFVRVFQVDNPTYLKIDETLAYFDVSGVSTNANYKWNKKHEDHLVRWKYYPEYRKTLKCFRQILRAFFRRHCS